MDEASQLLELFHDFNRDFNLLFYATLRRYSHTCNYIRMLIAQTGCCEKWHWTTILCKDTWQDNNGHRCLLNVPLIGLDEQAQ